MRSSGLRWFGIGMVVWGLAGCGSGGTVPGTGGDAPVFRDIYPSASSTRKWVREVYSDVPTTTIGVGEDQVSALAATSDGVVMAGYSIGTLDAGAPVQLHSAQAVVAKFDESGKQLWLQHWNGGVADFPQAVAVDGAQTIYVGARTLGSYDANIQANSKGSGVVFALDRNGVRAWTRQLDVPAATGGFDVRTLATSSDGFVYALGAMSSANTGAQQGVLWKLRANDGAVVWSVILGAPTGFFTPEKILVSASGGVVITEEASSTGSRSEIAKAGAMRVSPANGDVMWTQTLTAPTDQPVMLLQAAAIASDGDLIVAGATGTLIDGVAVNSSAAPGANALLAKLDIATGSVRWMKPLKSSGAGDQIKAIAASANGDLYALAHTNGGFSSKCCTTDAHGRVIEDLAIFRFDGTGTVLSVQQFGTGPVYDYQISTPELMVSSGTSLYVAGHTVVPYPGYPLLSDKRPAIFVGQWGLQP